MSASPARKGPLVFTRASNVLKVNSSITVVKSGNCLKNVIVSIKTLQSLILVEFLHAKLKG